MSPPAMNAPDDRPDTDVCVVSTSSDRPPVTRSLPTTTVELSGVEVHASAVAVSKAAVA